MVAEQSHDVTEVIALVEVIEVIEVIPVGAFLCTHDIIEIESLGHVVQGTAEHNNAAVGPLQVPYKEVGKQKM